MGKEEKKPKKENLYPKFPAWAPIEYKDQIEHYFMTIRKLINVGLNPKTKISTKLMTKANKAKVFGPGYETLKTTSSHLHLTTKRKFVKLYWQVYGTTNVTNNKFYLWFVRDYIAQLKGKSMNWAKAL
jgi:hypothetical protein